MQKRSFTLTRQSNTQINEEYEQWLNEFVGIPYNKRSYINNPYYQPIQGA